MTYPAVLALAVLGITYLLSGTAMVRLPRARASAILLAAGGALLTGAAVGQSTGHHDLAVGGLVVAGVGLLPLSLTAYPSVVWRHPVDFVAWVTILGSALVACLRLGDYDVAVLMGFVVGCVLVAHTWWKIERASSEDRRSLVWMSLAASIAAMVVFVVSFMQLGTVGQVTAFVVLAAVGPAMVIGVRRPEVVDARGLVVQVVVLVTAIVAYVALFMVVVTGIQVLGGPVPPLATLAVIGAVAATTFHPLQVVLHGVMDELLFGRRPDPLGAAAQVAEQVGDDPALAMRAIRESLVLPYVALRVPGAAPVESGVPVTHTRTVELTSGGTRIGELVVGLRPGDLTLPPGDAHVLTLVAPLLAQTLRARALAEDLQSSRGQAIAAIEEERRRLRRDLHDGLGPRLSGIAFTADAARNHLRSDPDGADALLESVRRETVTAIEDIRRLVYGMRPPALDELGLVPALEQQAVALRTPHGQPLDVDIETDALPPLPAAVEVAVYRIVTEALTNAARHSESTSARVQIQMRDGALEVEVTDRGRDTGPWHTGVGLSSMRERAAEVGGTLDAAATREGGRVCAALPLG
jgi:two-component system, NarL family, sensor kinase